MMTRITKQACLLITILAVLACAGSSWSQINEYKAYTATSTERIYFSINFTTDSLFISAERDSMVRNVRFGRKDLVIHGHQVNAGEYVLFDSAGVHVNKWVLPYDSIWDITVERIEKSTEITFTEKPGTSKAARVRRGNLLTFNQDINIDTTGFIRGVIFSVLGNVRVEGEVNRSVVSLFGKIDIAPKATLRGDVVSITGTVTAPKQASIYGEVYSGVKSMRGRKHRLFRTDKEIQITAAFRYNRVDGATPYLGLRFQDKDQRLPTVWFTPGYAFASHRGRFEAGIEQTILRRTPVKVGLTGFRRLDSGDDWLLSDNENLVYTLLATEDFKDYYEAQGGTIYVEARPQIFVTVRAGYLQEETNWLRAHRHLWSLFGGQKIFRENFSTIDSAYRDIGIQEIDTSTNGALFLSADFDTREKGNPFKRSAWAAHWELETASDGLGSDYDYERTRFCLTRYQKVNNFLMLVGRGMAGLTSGHVPMYRQFAIGGLGTLYGLPHKRHPASDFLMGNFEARVDLPRTELAFGLLYDVAAFSPQPDINTDDSRFSEDRSTFGGAIYYGDSFRFSVARPIDGKGDNAFRIYVRLGHHF